MMANFLNPQYKCKQRYVQNKSLDLWKVSTRKMLSTCVSKVTAAASWESLLRTSSALVDSLSVLSLTERQQQTLLPTDVSVRFRIIRKKTLSQ